MGSACLVLESDISYKVDLSKKSRKFYIKLNVKFHNNKRF